MKEIKIKKIFYLPIMLLLVSCNILPGMQNPSISTMRQVPAQAHRPVTATLIPITTALLNKQQLSLYHYRVAPADVLNITVWQHPELAPPDLNTNQMNGMPSHQGAAGQPGFLVNSQGTIYFPLVNTIKVSGKTVEQIREDLSQKLSRFIRHPAVNVRVADFRSRKIYVLGEVKKPGFIPVNDQPLSITDAIVMTGGLDPNAADPEHIYVIRGNIEAPMVYWLNARTPETLLLAEHFNLNPGDILFVSSAPAARWNRIINQLLPTIQTIWYTKAIVDSN